MYGPTPAYHVGLVPRIFDRPDRLCVRLDLLISCRLCSIKLISVNEAKPWYHEFGAGLSVATVSIPAALASGVLSYSALGPSYLLAGAVFGLLSGALSALLSATVFRSSTVAGPVSTVCVTHAILIASLASHPTLADDPGRIIALMTACLLLTGVAQIVLATLKVGSIIEFTPYPVVAGFLNGVAFLTMSSQLLFILQRPSLSDLVTRPPSGMAEVAPLVFLGVFVAICLVLARVVPRLPAAAVNFATGIALYYAALTVVPEHWLGPRLSIASGTLQFALTGPFEVIAAFADLPRLIIGQVVLGALTIAAIGVIEMSMTARMVENASHQRLDKHSLLLWLGITNMLAAPMGVPSSGSMSQTAARWRSGGVGPVSDLARASAMIFVATVGIGFLDYVPVIVVCGQLVMIGIGIFDTWSVRQMVRMARSPSEASRHVARRGIAVIGIVMFVTASGHVVLGAALGVAAACWIFIADSARPLIRSRLWGDVARSKKTRPISDLAYLAEGAKETRVLVLQGPIFFGNAVELSREINRLDPGTIKTVILDLRRVTSLDVSAIATFSAVCRGARTSSRHLAICGVPDSIAFLIDELKSYDPASDQLFFVDLDSALECCEERRLAQRAGTATSDGAIPLDQVEGTRGFSGPQVLNLMRRMNPLSYSEGEFLCREGDQGDMIWFIVQGSVSIWIAVGGQEKTYRVGSYMAGTAVGEIAFLNGTRRSASIMADAPVQCFGLSKAGFEDLSREDPSLSMLLLKNIASILAERLSVTTDQIRAFEAS
jgi:SulP family sulfate permease